MAANIRFFPRADVDLDEAFAWYAEHADPDVAERFFLAVFSTAEMLLKQKRMGSPRWQWISPKLEGVRSWPIRGFDRWLLFYRPFNTGIDVIRILHSARDMETLFTDTDL